MNLFRLGFLPVLLFAAVIMGYQSASADGPIPKCENQKIIWVKNGSINTTFRESTGVKVVALPVNRGSSTCVSPSIEKLPVDANQWTDIKKVVITRSADCPSGKGVIWTNGGEIHFSESSAIKTVTSWTAGCVYGDKLEISPTGVSVNLYGEIDFEPPLTIIPKGVQPAAVTPAATAPSGVSGSTATNLDDVMKKYNIQKNGERFVIPEITDKSINLAERLTVIEMVATNERIPPSVLKAICWQEGWDRYTGRRCENWYKGSGGVITSADGNGLCSFQITLRWHPETDEARIRRDFTYCVTEGARVVLQTARPADDKNPLAWEPNIKRFGPGNNPSYIGIVMNFLRNPPVNPDTGKPAW